MPLITRDLADMTYLDPDTSAFTTMLMKIGSGYRKMVPAGRLIKGDWVNDKDGSWYVSSVVREDADDWFNEKRLAVLEKPWRKSGLSRRVMWLEDELFWGQKVNEAWTRSMSIGGGDKA